MTLIKNPISIVQSGGGGVSRPTTWAEFAGMTSTDMQKVYGVGDRVGIACSWSDISDLTFQIAGWGTTKLENDNTLYPCVTLVSMTLLSKNYEFDAAETPLEATEINALAGIYYFGFDGTNYTYLNLSTGDAIPYSDYTAVYKTDATSDVTNYRNIITSGYNNYAVSNIREWLNSNGTANAWWSPAHVGDGSPSYSNEDGFLKGLASSFVSILQPIEVATANDTVYDKIFIPSLYEKGIAGSYEEGEIMRCYTIAGNSNNGAKTLSPAGGGTTLPYLTRTRRNVSDDFKSLLSVTNRGAQGTVVSSTSSSVNVACKIILAGA